MVRNVQQGARHVLGFRINKGRSPMQATPLPGRPWEQVAADLLSGRADTISLWLIIILVFRRFGSSAD